MLGRFSARKFRASNQFQHIAIVFEDIRDEFSELAASGNADKFLEEQGGRAAILIVVCNGDGELRALVAGRVSDEAGHRDQPLAGLAFHTENQSDVIAEIELGEGSKLVRCERRNGVKEASVDAPR